jgi:hypothetical protein
VIESGGDIQRSIKWTIYVQHIDATYDSVNFDDPISTLSYFKKIGLPFFNRSEDAVDEMFKRMTLIFNKRTEKGSKLFPEVQAQQIMRSAAEKVHLAFQELNRDHSYTTTVLIVGEVIAEAWSTLARLTRDCINEEHEYLRMHHS